MDPDCTLGFNSTIQSGNLSGEFPQKEFFLVQYEIYSQVGWEKGIRYTLMKISARPKKVTKTNRSSYTMVIRSLYAIFQNIKSKGVELMILDSKRFRKSANLR